MKPVACSRDQLKLNALKATGPNSKKLGPYRDRPLKKFKKITVIIVTEIQMKKIV